MHTVIVEHNSVLYIIVRNSSADKQQTTMFEKMRSWKTPAELQSDKSFHIGLPKVVLKRIYRIFGCSFSMKFVRIVRFISNIRNATRCACTTLAARGQSRSSRPRCTRCSVRAPHAANLQLADARGRGRGPGRSMIHPKQTNFVCWTVPVHPKTRTSLLPVVFLRNCNAHSFRKMDRANVDPLPFEKATRSGVWNHFRRGMKSATCLLCDRTLVYNGGTTSNLLSHLQRKHPSKVSSPAAVKQEPGLPLPSVAAPAAAQASLTKFVQAQPRSTKPCSSLVQHEITRILSRWPWLDMRPISIVRDQGLKELLRFLEPNYIIPSTTHVTSLIKKNFADGKGALSARLRQADSLALTTDIWTSKATQAFATTTGHFVDNEWNLVSVCPGDHPLPRQPYRHPHL